MPFLLFPSFDIASAKMAQTTQMAMVDLTYWSTRLAYVVCRMVLANFGD